ncbi:uncharacterized protein LOC144070281 [Stigmatopora argus]
MSSNCNEILDTEQIRKIIKRSKGKHEFLQTKVFKQQRNVERLTNEEHDQDLLLRMLKLQMKHFLQRVEMTKKTSIVELALLQEALSVINQESEILGRQHYDIKKKQHILGMMNFFISKSAEQKEKHNDPHHQINQWLTSDFIQSLKGDDWRRFKTGSRRFKPKGFLGQSHICFQTSVLEKSLQHLGGVIKHTAKEETHTELGKIKINSRNKKNAKMQRIFLDEKRIRTLMYLAKKQRVKKLTERKKVNCARCQANRKQELDQREEIMKERDELEIVKLKLQRQRDQLEETNEDMMQTIETTAMHCYREAQYLQMHINEMTRTKSQKTAKLNLKNPQSSRWKYKETSFQEKKSIFVSNEEKQAIQLQVLLSRTLRQREDLNKTKRKVDAETQKLQSRKNLQPVNNNTCMLVAKGQRFVEKNGRCNVLHGNLGGETSRYISDLFTSR